MSICVFMYSPPHIGGNFMYYHYFVSYKSPIGYGMSEWLSTEKVSSFEDIEAMARDISTMNNLSGTCILNYILIRDTKY